MENQVNPTSENSQPLTFQSEEMKIETNRKLKVKTISNQIYTLELPQNVNTAISLIHLILNYA